MVFIQKFYNLKTRKHGNGLVEYRLYEKFITLGRSASVPKSNTEFFVEPFDNEVIEVSRFLDSDGFSVPVQRDRNESIRKSLKRTVDKVFDYSNAEYWEWFCTFTFSDDKVSDRSDYGEIQAKMTKWLNNMRQRYCPGMKYVLVPEKHKDGSYHLHGLFRDCDELGFVPAINQQQFYKGKRNKYYGKPLVRKGEQVYDIKKFTLGFSDCTKVRDTKKCANYILKYITKEMIIDTANRKRYWNSQNLTKVCEDVELVEHSVINESTGEIIEGFGVYSADFVMKLQKEKPETYWRTFELSHGDYTNNITYIYC